MASKGSLSPSYSARLSSSPVKKSKARVPVSPSSLCKAPPDDRLVPDPLSQGPPNYTLSKSSSSVRRRLLFIDDDNDDGTTYKHEVGNEEAVPGYVPRPESDARGSENSPLGDYERLCSTLMYQELFERKGLKSLNGSARRKNLPFSEIVAGDLSPSSGKLTSDSPCFAHEPVSEATMKTLSAAYTRPDRVIPTKPEKVLYVPGIFDDYYLNLMSWSKDNVVAITLESGTYLWNVETNIPEEVFLATDSETSLGFSPSEPSLLAVGTDSGSLVIHDIQNPCAPVPVSAWELESCGMIGTLDWSQNGSLLACGTKSGSIGLIDHRVAHKPVSFMGSCTGSGHAQDVCGLKWNPQGSLVASGGNDDLVMVWDVRNSASPLKIFTGHCAAVRALAWSPHVRGQLVSGGGTTDKTIRFWDTNTLTSLGKLDAGSQVCGLHWSSLANEIVSTHGFSQNHVKIWDAKTRGGIAVLCGHTSRILYLAVSPDERKILTGSPDESLCFWNLYPVSPSSLSDSFR